MEIMGEEVAVRWAIVSKEIGLFLLEALKITL